jgi:hypothetical protein
MAPSERVALGFTTWIHNGEFCSSQREGNGNAKPFACCFEHLSSVLLCGSSFLRILALAVEN